MTARIAIARALWLKETARTTEKDWQNALAWHDHEVSAKRYDVVAHSAIGKCFARADKVLRLLDAAGLKAVEE